MCRHLLEHSHAIVSACQARWASHCTTLENLVGSNEQPRDVGNIDINLTLALRSELGHASDKETGFADNRLTNQMLLIRCNGKATVT
jgi:hypothetical protein